MRKAFLALLALCLTCHPAYATCGSRGFGSTLGSGTTDSVATGYNTAAASSISLSAWFYRNGAGGNSLGRIIDQNGSALTQSVTINDNTSAIAGTMAFTYGGNSTSGKWHWTTPSSSAWHNVVVTFNGTTSSNTPLVYIDGSAVSVTQDTAFTAPGHQATGNFYAGNNAAGTRNWDGKLADVAYWNAILTANEAKALGQGMSPLQVRPASLQIFLPLCGVQANEPDWASRLTQTIVGTLGKTGGPAQPYPHMRTGF